MYLWYLQDVSMPLFVSRFLLQPLLREAVILFSTPAVNYLLLSQYYYALFSLNSGWGAGEHSHIFAAQFTYSVAEKVKS